jgi:hypothetical protein
MAHLDPATRWWIGNRHGEADPTDPRDLWCAGCHAWTRASAWRRHTWHSPNIPPTSVWEP